MYWNVTKTKIATKQDYTKSLKVSDVGERDGFHGWEQMLFLKGTQAQFPEPALDSFELPRTPGIRDLTTGAFAHLHMYILSQRYTHMCKLNIK